MNRLLDKSLKLLLVAKTKKDIIKYAQTNLDLLYDDAEELSEVSPAFVRETLELNKDNNLNVNDIQENLNKLIKSRELYIDELSKMPPVQNDKPGDYTNEKRRSDLRFYIKQLEEDIKNEMKRLDREQGLSSPAVNNEILKSLKDQLSQIEKTYPLTREDFETITDILVSIDKIRFKTDVGTMELPGAYDPENFVQEVLRGKITPIQNKIIALEKSIKRRIKEEGEPFLPFEPKDISKRLVHETEFDIDDENNDYAGQIRDNIKSINEAYNKLINLKDQLTVKSEFIIREVDSFESIDTMLEWFVLYLAHILTEKLKRDYVINTNEILKTISYNVKRANSTIKNMPYATVEALNSIYNELNEQILQYDILTNKVNEDYGRFLHEAKQDISYILINRKDTIEQLKPELYDALLKQANNILNKPYSRFDNNDLQDLLSGILGFIISSSKINELKSDKETKILLNQLAPIIPELVKLGEDVHHRLNSISKGSISYGVECNALYTLLSAKLRTLIGLDIKPYPNLIKSVINRKKFDGRIPTVPIEDNYMTEALIKIIKAFCRRANDISKHDKLLYFIKYKSYTLKTSAEKVASDFILSEIISSVSSMAYSNFSKFDLSMDDINDLEDVSSVFDVFGGISFKAVQMRFLEIFNAADVHLRSDVVSKFTSHIISNGDLFKETMRLKDYNLSKSGELINTKIIRDAIFIIKNFDKIGKRKIPLKDEEITADLLINNFDKSFFAAERIRLVNNDYADNYEYNATTSVRLTDKVLLNTMRSLNSDKMYEDIALLGSFVNYLHNEGISDWAIEFATRKPIWREFIKDRSNNSLSVQLFKLMMVMASSGNITSYPETHELFSDTFITNFSDKLKKGLELEKISADFTDKIKLVVKLFYTSEKISDAKQLKGIIYEVDSGISILNDLTTNIEYTKRCNPAAYGEDFGGDITKDKLVPYKDKNLFKLNLQINEVLRWRVLGDYDNQLWKIGAETNCCQRYNGFGHWAAADSYINKLASVVVLEGYNDDAWFVIAQCYFHYVPEDNAFILDNVEASNDTAYTNLIPACLAKLGEFCKNQLKAKYLKLGKAYSNECMSLTLFSSDKIDKDPRYFAVDESNDHIYKWDLFDNKNLNKYRPYTDFSYRDHLDMYSPTIEFTEEHLKLPTI